MCIKEFSFRKFFAQEARRKEHIPAESVTVRLSRRDSLFLCEVTARGPSEQGTEDQ